MAKREARLNVNVLKDCVLSRKEALDLAAKYADLIGDVCHGKGIAIETAPFEREIRSAAQFVAGDLRDLLEFLAANPEAERIRIMRVGDSIAPAAVLDDELAWLALARSYINMSESEVRLHDEVMAPFVAMLRSRERARKFSKDAERVMGAA